MDITIYILLLLVAAPYPAIRYYTWRTLREHDPVEANAIRDALGRPMRRLWWAWLIAVAVCGGAAALLGFSSGTALTLFGLAFAGFHLVWWPFAAPVVHMLNRELEARGLQLGSVTLRTQRTASLTPRSLSSYLPVWALAAPWLLALACTGYLAWSAAAAPPPSPMDWAWFAIFIIIPWGCLALYTWWLCSEVLQSYPMQGSEWTIEARLRDVESMRRFRVRGIYVLMLAMMLTMFYNARLALAMGQDAAGGHGGAIGVLGMLVGFLGAAFGIEASFRYHRAMRTGEGSTAETGSHDRA